MPPGERSGFDGKQAWPQSPVPRVCGLAHRQRVDRAGSIGDPPFWKASTPMSNAIAAHKHRTMLHILRDRVKRALRDEKHGVAGAAERVITHRAKREAYRTANP
jgi:hypothetical protein